MDSDGKNNWLFELLTDTQKVHFAGYGLVIAGLGTILFGGYTMTSGSYFEIFGFRFGRGEWRPMTSSESWFWGLALIAGGAYILYCKPHL